MTMRYGIDTSVLMRLITGQPAEAFEYCVSRLSALVEGGAEILASNQVIGEAYVAVQHHYGVSRQDARDALVNALQSGLVSPLNGQPVLGALSASGHPGLFDRLIADDYSRAGLKALTLDRRMARLPDSQHL
jgi:predicted nucleic acid-binding protein